MVLLAVTSILLVQAQASRLGGIVVKKPGSMYREEVVQEVNSKNGAPWVAGYNPRVHDLSMEEFKGLLGTYRGDKVGRVKLPLKTSSGGVKTLPTYFDARKKWSNCPTISHIRDQGHCGSCWAFGAVETLSDRFCVAGNESVNLSTNDLLSCCGELCGDGCNGGWPANAWVFMTQTGIVTEKCEPYFDQIGCKHPGCEPVMDTPVCRISCSNGESWKASKHYAKNSYGVGPSVEDIMAELFTNGPVQVDFDVYEDFAYYKSGVYTHVSGDLLGGHSVKLIGWGTDKKSGVPYWLIANSWNRKWGENGYFRIRRGTNEVGIEQDAVAGLPKLKKIAVE